MLQCTAKSHLRISVGTKKEFRLFSHRLRILTKIIYARNLTNTQANPPHIVSTFNIKYNRLHINIKVPTSSLLFFYGFRIVIMVLFRVLYLSAVNSGKRINKSIELSLRSHCKHSKPLSISINGPL